LVGNTELNNLFRDQLNFKIKNNEPETIALFP